jgi:hypothetical protein
MNAISTFLDSLLFAAACAVGWLVFPVLLIGGAAALFGYAVIAEVAVTMLQATNCLHDETAARKTAERLCGAP